MRNDELCLAAASGDPDWLDEVLDLIDLSDLEDAEDEREDAAESARLIDLAGLVHLGPGGESRDGEGQ
jgi:hypothetical protein